MNGSIGLHGAIKIAARPTRSEDGMTVWTEIVITGADKTRFSIVIFPDDIREPIKVQLVDEERRVR